MSVHVNKVATCKSHGHIYGSGGTCIFCSAPKPEPESQEDWRIRLIKASQRGKGLTLSRTEVTLLAQFIEQREQ